MPKKNKQRALLLAAALSVGLAGSAADWRREDFDGSELGVFERVPGGNPRLRTSRENGCLRLVDAGARKGDLFVLRKFWNADPATGAAVEARVRVVSCHGLAGVMLLVADGVHEDILTLYPDRIALHRAGLDFPLDTTADFHVYRVDIRGQDIDVSVDGRRVIAGKGKFTFPAHQGRNRVSFGAGSSAATGEAYWDWIRWTVPGKHAPGVQTVPGAEHVVVYKDPTRYACFPSLRIEPKSETLYTSFGARIRASHIDPSGGAIRMRSRDGGRTWERIDRIPTSAVGMRPPEIFKAADGALIQIGQYFWRRYPAAKKKEFEGRYFIRDNCGPGPGKIAIITGGFLRRSKDGGKTWQRREIPELDAWRAASSAWSYGQLPDGTLLRAFMVQRHKGGARDCLVVRTRDGRNYDVVRAMKGDPAHKLEVTEENWLHLMRSGGVWMLARIQGGDDFMWQAFSEDGGRTWRQVKTGIRGHPPSSVLRLQDGRLLLTYGYRHRPYGIRAVLSDDDGRTWDTKHVLVLRADGAGPDLGYPRSVQLRDGAIVTLYYFMVDDGIRHIACTRWRVPERKVVKRASGE